MANRAYLAVSNLETLYPSLAEPGYQPERQLVATHTTFIPLLWLALFREKDLRRQVFHPDGGEIEVLGPLCRRETALGQLKTGLAYLEHIFPGLGPLREYGTMLGRALESVPFDHVTLELEEIGALYPRQHRFGELLTLALRGFDRPAEVRFSCPDVTKAASGQGGSLDLAGLGDIPPEIRILLERFQVPDKGDSGQVVEFEGFTIETHEGLLRRLTGLRRQGVLPPARLLLEGVETSPEDLLDHRRMLGMGKFGSAGCGMEVPWEKGGPEAGTSWQGD